MTAAPPYDIPGAIARLDSNAELYWQIVEAFLAEITKVPDQFDALLVHSTLADAVRLMHTNKGLALTVGANALAAVCRDAESTLKSVLQGDIPWEGAAQRLSAAVHSVVTTTAAELAALREQATAAAAPSESAPGNMPDAPTLLRDLQLLLTLLRSSDLRATEVATALPPPPSQGGDSWAALQTSVLALDFPRAVVQCETLIRQLLPNTPHDGL